MGLPIPTAIAAASLRCGSWVAAFLTILAVIETRPAGAAEPYQSFYKGKQIKIIVGSGAGGGYDLYCRFVARHLGKHIPGNPNVVVVNMPGAASVSATNYLANVAPKDGTELLMPVQTIPLVQVGGGANVRFDLAAFNWIGSVSDDTNVFVAWHTAGIRSIADLQHKELVVGATGPTAIAGIYPEVMNKILKTKFKIVYGYTSGAAIDLAMERGEINGRAGTSWSSLKAVRAERIKDKKLNVILQIGVRKEPDLADVPLMTDLARDEKERKVLAFYSSLTAVARALTMGPGVPPERVAMLRKAFVEAMHDPAAITDAAAQGLELRPIEGQDLQDIVRTMVETEPATVFLKK